MGDETSQSAGTESRKTPVVFVTDASVEAERIGDLLRAVGYDVVDVPRSMLASRTEAQTPNVVLVDIDIEGILDDIAGVRRVPGSGSIDFVYFGTAMGIVKDADDALAHHGSAFFLRPVDVSGLLRRLEALTGGPLRSVSVRPSTPPPSIPASRGLLSAMGYASLREPPALQDSLPPSSKPPSSVPRSSTPSSSLASERVSASPSLPSPGVRSLGTPLPSAMSLSDLVEPSRAAVSYGSVSDELRQLLDEAERRAETLAIDAPLPTPEEEIEAVLPADVLASLDEPLDGDDEDEFPDAPRASNETSPGREGALGRGATTGGIRHPTTGGSIRLESSVPTYERKGVTPDSSRGAGVSASPVRMTETVPPSKSAFASSRPALSEEPSSRSSYKPAGSKQPPSTATERAGVEFELEDPMADMSGGIVFDRGDARKFFAEAVARRATGALCFEHDRVVRRVLLRDGDLVTAASWGEQESLVHFLGVRGDLPRDEVERLAPKIFPYGRHAGAALVARGWLGQDQLWSVLRAHAEWIASIVVALPGGVGQFESTPPGRLLAEPGVFGASTGPSVFVDLVRRSVAPEEAVELLGYEGSRITEGPRHALLAECNLSTQETDLLARATQAARTVGGTLSDVLVRAPDSEMACVVHALALLGVVEIIPALPSVHTTQSRKPEDDESRALDEEAIRSRIRARMELVEDGDYFAILGIHRTATSYEVRRAYLELRRAFEPSRILVPNLRELDVDVRKILLVLDEAYEILHDGPRRERYRRAIEARPS